MAVGAWMLTPPEDPSQTTPRRLSKRSFGQSIAQKCGRVLGLRTPSKSSTLAAPEPTQEPVYSLSSSALAEHEFEFRKGKISRSSSYHSESTRDPDSPADHRWAAKSLGDDRAPSKQSCVSSLPGSVMSDDEDESLSTDPSYQQAELKRIAKQVARKTDFSYRIIRNSFVAVDADGDGRLTSSEVESFCTHIGISASVAARFYALMDKDEFGNANWQKFMAVFAPVFKEVSAEPPCYATSRLCLPRGQRW
eukprot:gnl/MRDRNA2_/MRDRNA2_38279_c0_seq1.p1 gnl/MRDRNA2_/MRDRNA2_38279_c0~~gnl/MRDRNA2_/MRDRNA2_38279_c0_seq1.p1  ORF type:complete len:250 (-),score=46.80 gnl/MRDRNA2_/MRDRNA2_38279_c0_seq1:344-1093(-)